MPTKKGKRHAFTFSMESDSVTRITSFTCCLVSLEEVILVFFQLLILGILWIQGVKSIVSPQTNSFFPRCIQLFFKKATVGCHWLDQWHHQEKKPKQARLREQCFKSSSQFLLCFEYQVNFTSSNQCSRQVWGWGGKEKGLKYPFKGPCQCLEKIFRAFLQFCRSPQITMLSVHRPGNENFLGEKCLFFPSDCSHVSKQKRLVWKRERRKKKRKTCM